MESINDGEQEEKGGEQGHVCCDSKYRPELCVIMAQFEYHI
jgi:hypothetical protein